MQVTSRSPHGPCSKLNLLLVSRLGAAGSGPGAGADADAAAARDVHTEVHTEDAGSRRARIVTRYRSVLGEGGVSFQDGNGGAIY